jgi:SAM-dependent methyltransferase
MAISLKDRLMETTPVYRAWQAPFAERKFAPVLRHNDLGGPARVLDVGCGPGTNARHFAGLDYVGVDVNPAYIEAARRRHRGRFVVADVTDDDALPAERFDFVLINSFLHHLPDEAVRRVLARVADLLAPGGHVHALELVLPARRGIARTLARADRGDFARPLADWRELLSEAFDPIVFEPFAVGVGRMRLWEMVYFKGRGRANGSHPRTGREVPSAGTEGV